jgi:hypothetical protein
LRQCTEALQDILRSYTDFAAAYQDGIELLTLIKELTYSFEERRKLSDALWDIKETFYSIKQEKNMSLQRHHELFVAQVEVMEQVGITIEDKSLVQSIATTNLWMVPNESDRLEANEQSLAIRFIRGTFLIKMTIILIHYNRHIMCCSFKKYSPTIISIILMGLHLLPAVLVRATDPLIIEIICQMIGPTLHDIRVVKMDIMQISVNHNQRIVIVNQKTFNKKLICAQSECRKIMEMDFFSIRINHTYLKVGSFWITNQQ